MRSNYTDRSGTSMNAKQPQSRHPAITNQAANNKNNNKKEESKTKTANQQGKNNESDIFGSAAVEVDLDDEDNNESRKSNNVSLNSRIS